MGSNFKPRNFLWGALPENFQKFTLVPPYVFSKIWTNLVIWGPHRNKNLDQPLKWGTSPPVVGHLWYRVFQKIDKFVKNSRLKLAFFEISVYYNENMNAVSDFEKMFLASLDNANTFLITVEDGV